MPAFATVGLWVLGGLVLGAAATALARTYALRRQLIDHPGERRSHTSATPRGGGVSIVVVLLAALAVSMSAVPGHAGAAGLAGAGLLLVAGIGWVDDHRPLPALPRLGTHVLAAALLAWALLIAGGSGLDAATAFFAAVVLTNVWNFMDGIDGIAAAQATVVALAYALFAGQGPVFWLGLALVAASCGFLPFNFPRARIFLGDVGSGTLGYALAGLLALGSLQQEWGTRILLLFPLLPFLLDTTLTLLARIVRGEAWWLPHIQHAYQAWARARGGHAGVTLAYAGAALATVLAMFAMRSWSSTVIMATYLTFLLAGGLAWKRLRGFTAGKGPNSLRDRKP